MLPCINELYIPSGRENNFNILDSSRVSTQGVPYDFRSIMHYRHNAFSSNGQSTIVPRAGTGATINDLGQRNGFSPSDLRHVRILYGCDTTSEFKLYVAIVVYIPYYTMSAHLMNGLNYNWLCLTTATPAPVSWGQWSSWSSCSRTCNGGTRSRVRSCQNGDTCAGSNFEQQECNTFGCPGRLLPIHAHTVA